MRIFNLLSNQLHERKKREMLTYLKAIPTQQLVALGFSSVLMEQGISAWPWREGIDVAVIDRAT